MEELKLVWSYFKLGVLTFWEIIMMLAVIGGQPLLGIIFGGIPLIYMVCNRGGKSVEIIKAKKEKEEARQFWKEIPNTDLYAKLRNNPLTRECLRVYTQEDLIEGIVVMKERVQIGRERKWGKKKLFYSEYGLKELEKNEQKVLARWLIDHISKNRDYNWTITAAFVYDGGGSLEPIGYIENIDGNIVPDHGEPPRREQVGYEAKITFIEEKKPLTDW